MSARLLWCICVVVLGGLAGCSGLVPQAGDTPTATPAPVPSASPASTPVQDLVPGVTGRGIENLSALKAAHLSLLANTSYTATTTETRHYANGTRLVRHNITRRVTPAGARFHTVVTIDGPTRTDAGVRNLTRYEAYKEGTDLYLLEHNATDTHYRHRNTTHNGSNRRVLLLLAGLETRVTGEVSRAGRVLYRLEARRVTDADQVKRAIRAQRDADVQNISFQALVDKRGLIHEHRLTYTLTDGNDPVQYGVWTGRHHALGTTTVDRPAWYDDAIANTTRP